jgi:hypothetical protein
MPASEYRAQEFVWIPGSFWFLIPILGQFSGIAAAGAKRQLRVWLLVCAGYRDYGNQADRRNLRRIGLVLFASGGIFALGVAIAYILFQSGQVDRTQAGEIGSRSLLGAIVFCVVGICGVIWLNQRAAVRSVQITERSITLAGVSEGFVKALIDQRAAAPRSTD